MKSMPTKLSGAFRRGETPMTAIVKVTEDDYVPAGITLRSRIAQRIFTATLSGDQLRELEDDPRVVSVEASRPVRQVS
jgi:hypothetical protein